MRLRDLASALAAGWMVAAVPALAAAPAGRYAVSADTVLDHETRLTWQRAAAPGTYTWVNAIGYCNGLTLAGFTGWRLPTIRELQSLVDIRAWNPSIDTVTFPSTPPGYFWSSSPSAGVASNAWVTHFYYGYIYGLAQTSTASVRCVR